MVRDGINLFGRSMVDGLYESFDNNSELIRSLEDQRLSITVITFVPNPYDDPEY